MAWGMFLSIPCPLRIWDESLRHRMLLCFPFIGLLEGALWALAARVTRLAGCPVILMAAVMTVIPYLLTGFIHLDGYMDCCDAILSRRGPEERRRILKDSHVGSFSVIGFTLLVFMTFAVFASGSLMGKEWILIFLPAAARAACALLIFTLPPMEGSSYAGAFHEGIKPAHREAALIILAAVLTVPIVLFGPRGLSALAAAAASALFALYGYRNLGGMSGDISGFAFTLGEFCGAAVLLFIA